jgi:hypothetical protein
MALNIDEIYDLFTWDVSCSDEEYDARVERGIAEARKLRNIYPFIQPIVAGRNSKSVWEPCAKVVALKSDEELQDYMYLLLEWLQDMNWPGAEIIFDRLSQIPSEKICCYVDFSMRRAKRDEDESWQNTLEALKEHRHWY